MKTLPTLISFAAFLFAAFAANADNIVDRLRDASTAPENEKMEKLRAIAKEKDAPLKLHNYFFPKMETLLKQLGADEYEDREAATRALARLGGKAEKPLKNLLETTKDPEVKMRCKRILKNWEAKKDTDDALLTNATAAVLLSDENPKSNRDFIEYYFKHFNSLDDTLKKLLPKALEKSKGRAEIVPAILRLLRKTNDQNIFEQISQALKTISPDNATDLLRETTVWRAFDKLKICETYGYATKHGKRYSISDINDAVKKINAIPDIDLIKSKLAKKLIEKEHPFLTGVGIELVADDPAPYAEIIVERLRSVTTKNYRKRRITYVKDVCEHIKSPKKIFRKHIDAFLDYPYHELYSFGLHLIIEPNKFKKRLLEDLLRGTAKSEELAEFLARRYLDEKEKIRDMVVDKIMEMDIQDWHCPNLLRSLGSLGGGTPQLNEWLKRRLENPPESINYYTLQGMAYAKIDPDLIVVKILPLVPPRAITRDTLYHLEKCAEKNKPRLYAFIRRVFLSDPSYRVPPTATRLLLKNASDKDFEALLESLFVYAEKRSIAEKYKDRAPVFAQYIDQHPDSIEIFDKLLKKHSKMDTVIVAAIILCATKKHKEKGIERLLEIVKNNGRPCSHNTTREVWKFLIGAKESFGGVTPEIMRVIFRDASDPKADRWVSAYILSLLNPAHPKAIPELENFLDKHPDLPLWFNESICEALLAIDAENAKAKEKLEQIFQSSKKPADKKDILDILTRHGVRWKIPPDTFDSMKPNPQTMDLALRAMENSDENIPAATAFLKKSMRANKLRPDGTIDLIEKNPAFANAFYPDLVKKFIKNPLSKRLTNILKEFPERLEKYAPDLQKKCEATQTGKELDCFIYLLSFLEGENAPKTAEIARRKYNDKKNPFLNYALARTARDKKVRRAAAKRFIASLMKRPRPKSWPGNAVVDTMLLYEFKDIVEPFLKKTIHSPQERLRRSAIAALMKKRPLTEFALQEYSRILQSAIEGQNEEDDLQTIFRMLYGYPKEAVPLLPLIEKTPIPPGYEKIVEYVKEKASSNATPHPASGNCENK